MTFPCKKSARVKYKKIAIIRLLVVAFMTYTKKTQRIATEKKNISTFNAKLKMRLDRVFKILQKNDVLNLVYTVVFLY